MASRIRWRDTRVLSNGIIHRLAVWLGLACSPSLHVGCDLCTYHRKHPVIPPAPEPDFCYVHPDFCYFHGHEPVPEDCFRVCGKCGHAYGSAEDLLCLHIEEMGDVYPAATVEDVLYCPLCTHDW